MKNLAKLLTVILVLSLAMPTVFAAQVSVVGKDAQEGTTVKADIVLDNVPKDIKDISAITIAYTYDEEKLTFKSHSTHAEIFEGMMTSSSRIIWYDNSSDGSSIITADKLSAAGGVLCTLSFEKKEGAYGTTDIEITFAELADSSFTISKDVTVAKTTIDLGKEPENSGDSENGSDDGSDDNSGNNWGNNSGNSSNNNKDKEDKEDKEDAKPQEPVKETPDFKGFSDIAETNWGYKYALDLVEKGIISGDGGEKPSMRPNDNLTRAEAAKIALLSMNIEPDDTLPLDFKDADKIPSWAKPYIATAVKHGIISGYSSGNVGASDYITREQMLTMLSRAMNWKGNADKLTFKDSSDISVWAKDGIAYAAEIGVMTGYDDGTIRPKANITRLEVFAIVSRSLEQLR